MKPDPSLAPEHIVETACPLDCPDACSLDVTVQDGRITKIDGSTSNPITDGYICAKVRRFGERVYGADRLIHPAVRKGPKGAGQVRARVVGRSAGSRRDRMRRGARQWGGESILPYSYGGSNGLLTQDTGDADALPPARRVAPRADGVRGAHRRRQQALYGKMPSVTYQDYPEARLIIAVGRQPVRVRHPHRAVPPRGAAARRDAGRRSIRERRRWQSRPISIWPFDPGTDLPIALAIHRYLFESGYADRRFLERAHAQRRPAARKALPVDLRARRGRGRIVARRLVAALAECTRRRRRR